MKTAAVTLTFLSALVAAQDFGNIPSCGNTCRNDMVANQGTEEITDCEAGDLGCLCADPRFIYGLRDCAGNTCEGDEATQVIQAGIDACSAAGVIVTDVGSTGPAPTASATSTGSDGGAGGALTTYTTDGTAIVSSVSTGSGDIGDAITSAIESVSSAVESVTSRIGSMTSGMTSPDATTDGGPSETGDGSNDGDDNNGGDGSDGGDGGDGSDGGDGDGSGSEGGDDDGAAMQLTAAPAAILAAAGLAALIL